MASAGPAGARRRRASRRVLGGVLVTALALGVVALVLGPGVGEQRRASALAQVQGLLDPLPAAPTELWAARGRPEVVSPDGVLLLEGPGLALVGRATGTPQWRAASSTGEPYVGCVPLAEVAERSRLRVPVDRAVCRWASTAATGDAGGAGPTTGADLVDLVTGSVAPLAEQPGEPVDMVVVGEDVLLVAEEDQVLHVLRVGTASGEVGWSTSFPPWAAPEGWWMRWNAGADHAVVRTDDGLVSLSYVDGDVGPVPSARVVRATTLAHGERWVQEHDVVTERLTTGLHSRDGVVLLETDEWVEPAEVVDPRSPVLWVGGEVGTRTVDRVTGELVRSGTEPAVPRVQVDGVVLAGGLTLPGVVAFDERDGRVLWERTAEYTWTEPLTDGTVVLVHDGQGHDGRPEVLLALGLRDGRERWRVDLPTGGGVLHAADGMLLMEVDGGVRALGVTGRNPAGR